jgi:HlyD family secretion protein
VQSFQRKDSLVFSRLEIVESEVDEELSRRRRDHAEQEKGIRGSLARTERELLEVERRRADLAWDRAATGLRLIEITAPHAGFVVRERGGRGQRVRVGDTVWRGQKLGELPDLSRMQAEVWVLEADAGGVAPGQRARVVVESRPGEPLEGSVARVDAVPKPRVPASPVQYFGVTLDLAEMVEGAWKPGQRVRAEILVEEREEALVVPRQAVFEGEGGAPVVYRRQGRGGFTAVPVILGPMTPARVVVTAGLTSGDRIALRDPHRGPDEAVPERPGTTPGAPATTAGGPGGVP